MDEHGLHQREFFQPARGTISPMSHKCPAGKTLARYTYPWLCTVDSELSAGWVGGWIGGWVGGWVGWLSECMDDYRKKLENITWIDSEYKFCDIKH